MRYEGPIYRPPSEADSVLVQATVGCPHNQCTFCMVYKRGPRYKVRASQDVMADLTTARKIHGPHVRTLFLPAGNTIAMPTEALCRICDHAGKLFPHLERITVYGSSHYILQKGASDLKKLRQSGLSRIHVGLESGDDVTLARIKKGVSKADQIQAGRWAMEAGMTLSLYVVLGMGSRQRTTQHAQETADALNQINPDFIRFRTFLPKVDTPLLREVKKGTFEMLGPHETLWEMANILEALHVTSLVTCDHYTNYLQIEGRLPEDRETLLFRIETALKRPEHEFRSFFVGTQ